MREIILSFLILFTFLGCSRTIKKYNYYTYKKFVNNKWINRSNFKITDIEVGVTLNKYFDDPLAYGTSVNISEETTYLPKDKQINHKIIFKNSIKIKFRGKIYNIEKKYIKTYHLNDFRYNTYEYYFSIDRLKDKIDGNFIVEIGNIEVNGKKIYIPPIMFRKHLHIEKYNVLLDSLNQNNGSEVYYGWADEYKGK